MALDSHAEPKRGTAYPVSGSPEQRKIWVAPDSQFERGRLRWSADEAIANPSQLLSNSGKRESRMEYKTKRSNNIPRDAHALTFSTLQRQPLLARQGVAEAFLEAVANARRCLAFQLWAYVVMPEHAHLLVWPERPDSSIGPILRAIKMPSAKVIFSLHPDLRDHCRVQRKDEPDIFRIWEPGGGYDRNIRNVKAAWRQIHYIHRNPVTAGLVGKPEEWQYSSAGAYLETAIPTLIPVDRCPWWLD